MESSNRTTASALNTGIVNDKVIDTSVMSQLPVTLIARCVSFLVESPADVARLRLVNCNFGPLIKANIVGLGEETSTGVVSASTASTSPAGNQRSHHQISFPNRSNYDDSFIKAMLAFSNRNEDLIVPGDVYDYSTSRIGLATYCKVQEFTLLKQLSKTKPKKSLSGSEKLEKLVNVCKQLYNVKTEDDVTLACKTIEEYGLYKPKKEFGLPPRGRTGYLALLKLNVRPKTSKDREYAWTMETLPNGSQVISFPTSMGEELHAGHNPFALKRVVDAYDAPVLSVMDDGTYSVAMLAEVVFLGACYYEDIADALWHKPLSQNLIVENLWKMSQSSLKVEGVVIVDSLLEEDSQTKLNCQVQAFATKQEADGSIDYHPNSNNVVRDIVHPGLYSYVKGVSQLKKSISDAPPCIYIDPSDNHDDMDDERKKDFWGRPYEKSKFQWLPTYFNVNKDGRCTIDDYINNLVPRDDPVVEALYDGLARLFEQCLPYMESVYSYVHTIRPNLRDSDEESVDWSLNRCQLDVLPPMHRTLRGQKLQVITKIVDYELVPGQNHSGVWHVEGMSHEEVVLTALYILDRDEKISGGDLEFKRAMIRDEATLIFQSVNQIRPTAVENKIRDGLIPLGKVETRSGRLIVFPNSHVHRVDTMVHDAMKDEDAKDSKPSSKKSKEIAKRRIVVFFLVNPLHRIVSTREVPPQQGIISRQKAMSSRLALMKERKYHKQDWNVRQIELCEH